MAWQTKLRSEYPIVETVFSGMVNRDELELALQGTLECLRANDAYRVIADCTTMLGGHSVTDLYFLAEALTGYRERNTLREAVLLPVQAAASEQVRFWETTCFNRGLAVRVFSDRAEALTWLMQTDD